jgi:hypothetical protein
MPPPPHGHHGHHGHHDRAAASAIGLVLDTDRLMRILAPWIPDAGERTFVVRCIIGEGPIHHRGASYALIALAGAIAERLGASAIPSGKDAVQVPMRQAPHMERHDQERPVYPLSLDPSGIIYLAGEQAGVRQVLTDAVTDGPSHHALANVALLNLLAAILRQVGPRP